MQYLPHIEQKNVDFIQLAEDESILETPKYKVFQFSRLEIIYAFLFYIAVAYIAILFWADFRPSSDNYFTCAVMLAIFGIPLSTCKIFIHAFVEFLPIWKENFATNETLFLRGDIEYLQQRQEKFDNYIASKILNNTRDTLLQQKTLYLQGLLIEDQSYKKEIQEKLEIYHDILCKIEDLIDVCDQSDVQDDFYVKERSILYIQKEEIQNLRDQMLCLLQFIEKGEELRSVYALREEARFQVNKLSTHYLKMGESHEN